MSWTDKQSIRVINYLKGKFNVKTFIETGTHVGVNAQLHSQNFKKVLTCEKIKEYFDKAKDRCKEEKNVFIYKQDSVEFLKKFREEPMPIFYLDAHFYEKGMKDKTNEEKFVVIRELKALKGKEDCIIIIHDFDNNLGHITYDGQPLDLELIKKDLMAVNPNLKLYTNELSSCDIKRLEEAEDWEEFINLRYTWSKPEKTYRGILYAVPKEINIKGLKRI